MRSDVQTFLNSLQTYLYGDLETFKRICNEIEIQESLSNAQKSGTGSMSGGTVSSTITSETTTSRMPTTSSSYQTKFRSTIPHALAVLAAMDILGFLIGAEKDADGTQKNITLFLNPTITDQDQLNCLAFICRNGMSHSFFPKEKISIAAHSSLDGKDLFYLDGNSVVTLNVNTLIKIMKTRFDNILADTSIHSNIETQFDKLTLIDQGKLNKKGLDLTNFATTLKQYPLL